MKKESCGVFGVVSQNKNRTSDIIYNGLMSLQHRGQESGGISILNSKNIILKKFMGLVTHSMPASMLSRMKGKIGIGHVRYSTVGRSRLRDAQPFRLGYPKRGIVLSQNGNGIYLVSLSEENWICSCPDHKYRKVKCKHAWAVEFSIKLKEEIQKDNS